MTTFSVRVVCDRSAAKGICSRPKNLQLDDGDEARWRCRQAQPGACDAIRQCARNTNAVHIYAPSEVVHTVGVEMNSKAGRATVGRQLDPVRAGVRLQRAVRVFPD
jgi:hypothetical protein